MIFGKDKNFIENSHPNKIKPSEKTLARLIESAKENAENLPRLLNLFPIDEKSSAIAKDIYDTQISVFDENQKDSIKKWLKYKTAYFSDELLAETQTAKDHKTYKTIGKEAEIRAGENNEGGLWKTNRSERIEFKKAFMPIRLSVGNWVVAAKAEQDWAAPNDVVRINLQTGKESKINLPPAEEFQPIAFVATLNKVLLYRAKEAYSTLNPTVAEYYLLDANTGKVEAVKGEFQPLITNTFRPLQPTGKTE